MLLIVVDKFLNSRIFYKYSIVRGSGDLSRTSIIHLYIILEKSGEDSVARERIQYRLRIRLIRRIETSPETGRSTNGVRGLLWDTFSEPRSSKALLASTTNIKLRPLLSFSLSRISPSRILTYATSVSSIYISPVFFSYSYDALPKRYKPKSSCLHWRLQ